MLPEQKDFHISANDIDSPANNKAWQVIYLDTFTLLLIFFIILTTLAHTDHGVLGDVAAGFSTRVTGADQRETPIDEVYEELNERLAFERRSGRLEIHKEFEEIRLHFLGSSFYRSAEADLLASGERIVDRIMAVLLELDHYAFHLDVEGHADSMPIRTEQFPSNWELSAARASNVVRYFIEEGMPAGRLKASGYADTFPVAPDYDAAGNPIPDNLDRNRRIVMRIHYGPEY